MRLANALLFLLAFSLSAQLNFEEEGERERAHYGMSQAEWKAFKESGMSIAELDELIVCGIVYSEYQTRPWLSLGVSRKKWIEERCKGMGDADVKAFHDRPPDDFTVIWAFLAPGSMHLKKKQYLTGSMLLGAGIASWGSFFLLPGQRQVAGTGENSNTYHNEEYKRAGFVVAALATSIVSSVLTYRQQNTKPADEVTSLSVTPLKDGVILTLQFRQ